jgi:flagellar basal body L-ring protein FlgH
VKKMRKLIALFVALLFATSMIVASGCAKKEEPAKPAAEPAKVAEPAKAPEPAQPAEPAKAPEPAKPAEPAKAPEKK